MSQTEQHCKECGTPRSQLKEIPWGLLCGEIRCKPCASKMHEEKKQAAIAEAKEKGHDELDCLLTDEIICPVCASVISDDDIHESTEMECDVCDAVFELEVEYSKSYTTTVKENQQ
jgi:hypothetical protein